MKKITTAFVLLLLNCGFASAQELVDREGVTETSNTSASDDWSFRVAPYVWATALNGDIGVDGVTSHVNASMGEVLEHVEGGAMLTAEARYKEWGLVTDFIYADLADRKYFNDSLIESTKLHINQYIWSQAVAYRAFDRGKTWVDTLAGFRLFSMDQTLSITARDPFAASGDISKSVSIDRTWIDPIVGLRGALALSDNWAIRGEGDVGGFDANSKFTWQAFAALGYDLAESTRVLAGYRGLGYNHDRDSFKYDTIMHGPIVGLGIGF